MAWYTGKSLISVACIGDSNAVGSGGVNPPGGQTYNINLRCYASLNGEVPYSLSNMGWRSLDPNATYRAAEAISAATVSPEGYVGQLLGGNGNSAMQMCSTLQAGTGENPVMYLYQTAAGGTTADDWANGDQWDLLADTAPGALSTIPGAPTYFDALLISLGTNDCNQDYTAEQYYTHMSTLRRKMVAAGWWVPNTTQVLLLDLPRNGNVTGDAGTYPGTWAGIQYVRTRWNDKISLISSVGMEIEPIFPVHYLPPSYTAMGVVGGQKLLAGIPRQRSTVSIGGTRVSVGGKKILVHGA